MRAIQFQNTGAPEVLRVSQIPQPHIQTGHDLLIKLKAIGINLLIKLKAIGINLLIKLKAIGINTVGGSVLSQCFAATRIYGDVVTLLAPAADTNWGIARKRNLRISYE